MSTSIWRKLKELLQAELPGFSEVEGLRANGVHNGNPRGKHQGGTNKEVRDVALRLCDLPDNRVSPKVNEAGSEYGPYGLN